MESIPLRFTNMIRSNARRLPATVLIFVSTAATSAAVPAQRSFSLPNPLLNRIGVTTTDVVPDFDGDGTLDVIKNTPGISMRHMFRGLGGGDSIFARELLPPGETWSVSQNGDLDGDGDLNLLVTAYVAMPVGKLVNDGTGRFTLGDLGFNGGPWTRARFGDINGMASKTCSSRCLGSPRSYAAQGMVQLPRHGELWDLVIWSVYATRQYVRGATFWIVEFCGQPPRVRR